MKKILISTFAACMFAVGVMAQAPTTGTTTKTTTSKPAPVQKTAADYLYEELLPSTAQIMFIDSVVVPKANFLAMIPLSSENGILKFEGKDACYYNEFETTKIYAQEVLVDSITERHIFTTHRDEDEWTPPIQRKELESILSESDFPFLLADGTTFYFAGKGEGSVGGYDIFKTTFDSEEGRFLDPHNMGMPFSSKANDYLLAINDIDNIGWLVTDRFQPEDTVCIYTFEPRAHRVNISDEVSNEERQSFADIRCISDTWAFGDREAALQRIATMKNRENEVKPEEVEFVLNDDITYTSLSDFKSAKGVELYKAIMTDRQQLAKQFEMLDTQWEHYPNVTGNEKATVVKNIGTIEKNIDKLEKGILSKEKQLRQAELKK